MIARVNGHSVERPQEGSLNDRLDQVRTQVLEAASLLPRR